jgi:hypothetical protein
MRRVILAAMLAAPAWATADCGEISTPLSWSDGPHSCVLLGPHAAIKEGEQVLHSYKGLAGAGGSGYRYERCVGGQRQVIAERCVRWCDWPVTITQANCTYSYGSGARARATKRVVEGQLVPIGSGRCAAQLTCRGGAYAIVK